MIYLFCFIAVVVGALVPLQAGINAHLRQFLGSPAQATGVSLTVSLLSVGVYFLFFREAIVPVATLSSVPWWAWTGGLCGTVLLLGSLIAAPKLGASSLIACVVAGQVICSMLLDHFGLVGYAVHQVSLTRVMGALLLIGGMLLIVKS